MLDSDALTDAGGASDDALPPETLAPDAPALVSDDPATGATDGPPRDAHGRYAPRDAAPDAAGPTGADPAAAPALGSAPTDPDAPDAPPVPPAASLTAPVAPAAPPASFAFAHRGQSHEVAGVTVAPDAAPRIAQLFARAREHETVAVPTIQRLTREVGEWQQRAQTRTAEMDAFAQLVETAQSPEDFLVRALEFYTQYPALKQQSLQQELAARDRMIAELRGQPVQPQHAPDGPSLEHDVRAAMAEQLAAVPTHPAFQGLTTDDLTTLRGQLEQRVSLYVRRATDQDAMLHGAEAGSWVFDADAFAHELGLLAAPTLQTRKQQLAKATAEKARAEAAKRNAALTTPTTAPPSPRTGAHSTDPTPRKKSREEWQRHHDDLMSGRTVL